MAEGQTAGGRWAPSSGQLRRRRRRRRRLIAPWPLAVAAHNESQNPAGNKWTTCEGSGPTLAGHRRRLQRMGAHCIDMMIWSWMGASASPAPHGDGHLFEDAR